jgi:hypothetical protein
MTSFIDPLYSVDRFSYPLNARPATSERSEEVQVVRGLSPVSSSPPSATDSVTPGPVLRPVPTIYVQSSLSVFS